MSKLEQLDSSMQVLRVDAMRLTERLDAVKKPSSKLSDEEFHKQFHEKFAARKQALATGAKPRRQYEMTREMQHGHGLSTEHQDKFMHLAKAHVAAMTEHGSDHPVAEKLGNERQAQAPHADREKRQNFKALRDKFNPNWHKK